MLKIKGMSKVIYMCTIWDPGVPAIHAKDQMSFEQISVKYRVCLHWGREAETAQWYHIRMKLDVQ